MLVTFRRCLARTVPHLNHTLRQTKPIRPTADALYMKRRNPPSLKFQLISVLHFSKFISSKSIMSTSTTAEEKSQDVAKVTSPLGAVELKETKPSGLINTPTALASIIDSLIDLPTRPPSLYFDIEGENLCRHGTVSILQIHVLPTKVTHLIDIYVLKDEAFTTCGSGGDTLKSILESQSIPKVFFDVRNDSDALFSHFNINLAGIQDLQLMELATRTFNRKYINGLAKCIERDALLSLQESKNFLECKEKGMRLFHPDRGGSYKVFNQRPLPEEILQYCVQDVHFLPRLWTFYDGRITNQWRQRVISASMDRVRLSQSADYNGNGKHMALAPKGWQYIRSNSAARH